MGLNQHLIIKELEPLRRNTLRFVLEFIEEISFYERQNGMCIEEIARQFGLIIFREPQEEVIHTELELNWT